MTFQLNLSYDAYHENLIFHQLLNFMLQSAARYDAEDAGGIHIATVMFLKIRYEKHATEWLQLASNYKSILNAKRNLLNVLLIVKTHSARIMDVCCIVHLNYILG